MDVCAWADDGQRASTFVMYIWLYIVPQLIVHVHTYVRKMIATASKQKLWTHELMSFLSIICEYLGHHPTQVHNVVHVHKHNCLVRSSQNAVSSILDLVSKISNTNTREQLVWQFLPIDKMFHIMAELWLSTNLRYLNCVSLSYGSSSHSAIWLAIPHQRSHPHSAFSVK